MRITPMLVALVLSTVTAAPFSISAMAQDRPVCGQRPMAPHLAPDIDLVPTLSDLLKLSNEQQSRLERELLRRKQQHRKERANHHRAMQARHHKESQRLESLLDPHQIELYRAFVRGLSQTGCHHRHRVNPSGGLLGNDYGVVYFSGS